MHATLFSSWCREAKISFWNPTAQTQTQSFDTQIFTTSTRADNQCSEHRCPISKALKEQCKSAGVPPHPTHVATVSRAYWVQKACAAYCLFETHNQGKSNVYTAFSWRTSTKTDKGNSPHSACWDCGPPECALDGSTKTSSSSAPLWRIISLFSLSARCSSHYKWPTRQLMRVFLVRTRVLIPP